MMVRKDNDIHEGNLDGRQYERSLSRQQISKGYITLGNEYKRLIQYLSEGNGLLMT